MKTILLYVAFIILYINVYVKAVYSPPKTHKVYEEKNDAIGFKNPAMTKNIKNSSGGILSTLKNFFTNSDSSDEVANEIQNSLQDNKDIDFKDIAIDHLVKETGVNKDELVVDDVIDDDNVVHVHISQIVKGKPLSNVSANVNINKKTKNVLSYGSNLMPTKAEEKGFLDYILPSHKVQSKFVYANQPNMTLYDAIVKFSKVLGHSVDVSKLTQENRDNKIIVKGVGYTYDDTIEVEEKVIPLDEKSYDSVFELTIELEEHLLVAEISSTTGELYDIYDLARSASYRVVPWNYVDVGETERKLVVDPENLNASPRGWNRDGKYLYYYTNGNNVKAVLDWNNDANYEKNEKFISTSTKKSLVFDYKYNKTAKDAKNNYQAAVTNAFYITNILHDFYYVYGFTEQYGNFQTNNFNKGGKDNDQLVVLIQNSGGNNNAFMISGADGKSPRMKLLVYNRIKDFERDPAFSNQVIIHEYTHGVSSRLVGGPTQTGCFKDPEADSINEGLSDFFSLLLTIKKGENRNKEVTWAKWLSNGTSRKYPYATNQKVNPLTYKDLSHTKDKKIEPHLGGQLFASIMYDVIWEVIGEYGFTSNILLNPKGEDSNIKLEVNNNKIPGNVRLAKIVVDALKSMPCNPTFLEARDSIFAAQRQFSNFKRMRCALWRGFAARGLGVNAKGPSNDSSGNVNYANNNEIPSDCKQKN